VSDARRLLRGESGATIVEFALVIPVVLLLILVALDFTRALIAYSTVGNASREGVRYAVLHPGATKGKIEQEVERRSQPLSPKALKVVVEYSTDGGATYVAWTPAGSTTKPRNVTVRVSVSYPWQAASAVAAGFLSNTTGSSSLVSTSHMETRR
jgi:Flp pilus assembly protein TadG